MTWGASLTALLETSIDGLVIVDRAGVVRGWNHHAEAIFGWRKEEALGRPLIDLVVPPFQRASYALRVAQIASGIDTKPLGTRLEATAVARDGRHVPIELAVMPIDHAGERWVVGFVRDLTQVRRARSELLRAKARLEASEERYRSIVELSGMVSWTADGAGLCNSVNGRWSEWTGAPLGAALGRGYLRFIHPDDVGEVERRWEQALGSAHRIDMTYRLRWHDGSYRWIAKRATRRPDGDGHATIWYGTFEDVHARQMEIESHQRTQAELEQVSRLGAMGAMASAIAHDLNQPLTAIAHYVRGSRRLAEGLAGPGKSDLLDALGDADRSIVRAGDIVRRVREFVTRGAVEPRVASLGEIVEDACRFALVDASEKGVSISLSLTADCPVFVDRVQLQQVLVNLIRNAVEAMEGAPHRELTVATSRRADTCEVAVSDTGRGVPAAARSKLFDPFYTTRANGMGVGLSISRTIVEGHGGTIWLDPSDGEGATFRFTLPLAQFEPMQALAAAG